MGVGAGADGTDVRHLTLRADASEAALLERFTAHIVLRDVALLDEDAFLDVLLQRRFLSLMFAVVYDIGIDGLMDPTAVALVREILREEYPDPSGATPSHREDLVADLLVLGASRDAVLGARPSAVTAGVLQDTLALMLDAAATEDDVAVLTILRFWGEVLVSVEYGEFWRRMEDVFTAAGATSRFYHPHHHHDGREPLALASAASDTHSGRLGACLAKLLPADGAAACFERTEQRVLDLRLRFYDQFLDQDDNESGGQATLYEFAGGAPAFLALATAHHARCLADPELNHPFSHPGGHPEHVERLAVYWAEVMGGPADYSRSMGEQSGVLRMHAGNGDMSDLGERFLRCFDAAADDAELPADPAFRAALHAYMRWAVEDVLAYSPQDATVPAGAAMPRWGWDGLQT